MRRLLSALALAVFAASAGAQYYTPAEQETLRNAKLPLLPGYFHTAAAQGNVDAVRKFLATDVRIDLRDNQGRSMLLLALESSVLKDLPEPKRSQVLRAKIEVARLLIDRGAVVIAKSKDGFNALHTAAHLGEMAELMELLIARGAEVNGVDSIWGRTALFVAADANDLRPMEVLLKHGADPNARDLKKWTPLLRSVLARNAAAAARLVKAGADPSAANADGITALQVAQTGGSPEMLEALKK